MLHLIPNLIQQVNVEDFCYSAPRKVNLEKENSHGIAPSSPLYPTWKILDFYCDSSLPSILKSEIDRMPIAHPAKCISGILVMFKTKGLNCYFSGSCSVTQCRTAGAQAIVLELFAVNKVNKQKRLLTAIFFAIHSTDKVSLVHHGPGHWSGNDDTFKSLVKAI